MFLCLVSSAWFLAWPEAVGTDDVWDSVLVFAKLLGGVAAGVTVRLVADRLRKPEVDR